MQSDGMSGFTNADSISMHVIMNMPNIHTHYTHSLNMRMHVCNGSELCTHRCLFYFARLPIIAGRTTTNEELEEMLEQGNSAVFTQGVCI